MYTNWEQDGSKQWETFLSTELPDWLARQQGHWPWRALALSVSPQGRVRGNRRW